MAKVKAKVTVKKGSKGGNKAPVKPKFTPQNSGGPLATKMAIKIKAKKTK